MKGSFKDKQTRLKLARDALLRLHKILMDRERSVYEHEHGALTAGKFLEMLMGDPRFEWLRVLSMLIVRIDEAFDLDDGLSAEMLEGFQREIRDIFDDSSDEYAEFKLKFNTALPFVSDAGSLRDEILDFVDW